MKILLIEDDPVLAEVLVQALTAQHYVTDVAEDGLLAWDYAQESTYDLLLMDVGLPKLDGISLCRRLRAANCTTPILLMTAKDAADDRIRGLDAGADDYLIKPLNLEELQARVRALLRRGSVSQAPVLSRGALRLDPSTCQVTYAAQPIALTPKEYSLLELFLRHPDRVFSRGQIVEHLWSFDDPPQEESVKAHIKGLRQKLKAAGAIDWIENVYGLGYRLRAISETEAPPPHSPTPPPPHSPTPPPQFQQAMDALWSQHYNLMQERMDVLRQAAEAKPLSPELQQAAAQAAHKLAGVLGMFDRPQGTTAARAAEQLLQQPSPNPAQLRSLIQDLDNAISPLSTPPPSHAPTPPPPPPPTPHSPTHLLLIDDDPLFLAALAPILEPWGFQLTTLSDPTRFWQVLPSAAPDLLLLDVDMPQVTGIELCEAVRADSEWQALPILFLTAHRDAETIQRVFAAGADDYITKPIVGAELLTRITSRLERIRLLQALSRKDPMTGLLNQTQSSRDLEALIGAARSPFCMALFQTTQLRQINLQYGHAVGNQVLQHWGNLFRAALPQASLGYWGSGEFVVGLSAPRAEADAQLASLLTTLRQQVFTAPDGERFQVLCRYAIAACPSDGRTLRSLYQVANSILDQRSF